MYNIIHVSCSEVIQPGQTLSNNFITFNTMLNVILFRLQIGYILGPFLNQLFTFSNRILLHTVPSDIPQ